MTKKRTAILWTIAIFLVVVFIAINAYIHVTNEKYINTQGSHLTLAYEENERLERELAGTKEQLMISNNELEMIYMSGEGIEYMEGDENEN